MNVRFFCQTLVVLGLALRFALNAPPFGLRGAALQAKSRTSNNEDKNSKRGHF